MTFTIFQTQTTPFAELKNGYLQIKGKSLPFNYPEIYDIIKDRLLVYMEKPEESTKIDFNLSVINAVSKRSIISTFEVFEEMSRKGCNLQVNWYYQSDDEDVYELGKICKSMFTINMQIIRS